MTERKIDHHEIPGVDSDVADRIAEIAFKDNVLMDTIRGNEDGHAKQAAREQFRANTQEVKDLLTPEHPIDGIEAGAFAHRLRVHLENSNRLSETSKAHNPQEWSFWRTNAQVLGRLEDVLKASDSVAVAKSSLAKKLVKGPRATISINPLDLRQTAVVEDSLMRKAMLPADPVVPTEFPGLGLRIGDRVKTGVEGDRTDAAGLLDRDVYMAVACLETLEIMDAQPKLIRQITETRSTPTLDNAVNALFDRDFALPDPAHAQSLIVY